MAWCSGPADCTLLVLALAGPCMQAARWRRDCQGAGDAIAGWGEHTAGTAGSQQRQLPLPGSWRGTNGARALVVTHLKS